MKPLSGPSEAHRTKNATFKQSYRPIVVAGQQSAGDPRFIPHDLLHITWRELNLKTWSSGISRGGKKQYIPEVTFPPQTKRLLASLHQCYHCWSSLKIVAAAVELLLLEQKRSKAGHSDRDSNIQPDRSTLYHQYCVLSRDKTSTEINFQAILTKMIRFQHLNREALETVLFFCVLIFWHWWMTIPINRDRITEH